ncbi:hypothetical protein O3P69_002534 [Scylla paramamosain]|uniref:Uncharacterized protein n=1 Tax=Scylla paramamosain TaxID=85552 RepID=A0AAW0UKY1_SCYPA
MLQSLSSPHTVTSTITTTNPTITAFPHSQVSEQVHHIGTLQQLPLQPISGVAKTSCHTSQEGDGSLASPSHIQHFPTTHTHNPELASCVVQQLGKGGRRGRWSELPVLAVTYHKQLHSGIWKQVREQD